MTLLVGNFVWKKKISVLRISGEGAHAFLHGQTTGNLLVARSISFVHAAWLDSFGLVRAILEIRLSENLADIFVLAGDINHVYQQFNNAIFPADKVKLEVFDDVERLQILSEDKNSRFRNIDWLFPGDQSKFYNDLTRLASNNEFECWRIKKGLPLDLKELNGSTNPYELGLADLISIDKGCYLGQEAIARFVRSGKCRQQLRLISSGTEFYPGQHLIKYSSANKKEKIAGIITSTVRDEFDKSFWGLALVKRNFIYDKKLSTLEEENLVNVSVPQDFLTI